MSKEFNVDELSGTVTLNGHEGTVLRSVRTARGIDVTVRLSDVDLVDADKVDPATVGQPEDNGQPDDAKVEDGPAE